MKLDFVNIEDLKISPLNVRKNGEKSGDDLVPSIRAIGIIQPLLVRPNCKGYEIIAGQRRFNALQQIAKDEQLDPVPCVIMDDGDDAAAIEASLAENIARFPMDAIDQFEAFQALTKQGRSVEDIAQHFGVTEKLVQQRLAIANLHPPIRNAFRREEFNAATLQILTMATTRQQKEWYKLFKSDDGYAPQGYQLKNWLFGGEQIPTSNAIFDLETYKGVIISDLFGEDQYFADSALFWEHQSQAIARLIEEFREDGWAEIILLDVGEHWNSWEHIDTAKEDGGKVYIRVSASGEVTPYEGQLTRAEIKRREKTEAGEDVKPQRPELTKTMQNYLALHRHAAVRAELLNHQGIVLRLCVAQIIAGSELWDISADPQKANTDAISDSLKDNKAEDLFAAERQAIRDMFESGVHKGGSIVPQKHDWDIRRDLGAIFKKLVAMDDETVNRIFAFIVAETLTSGSAMIEDLGMMLSVDMSDRWKPDETFFDLLRDKEAINAMLEEVGGKQIAEGNLTATAKVQKQIIQGFISGERTPQKKDWQPRYMAFPKRSYTKRG